MLNLQKVISFRKANEQQLIREYLEFVAIPNETNDAANIPLKALSALSISLPIVVFGKTMAQLKTIQVVFGQIRVESKTQKAQLFLIILRYSTSQRERLSIMVFSITIFAYSTKEQLPTTLISLRRVIFSTKLVERF